LQQRPHLAIASVLALALAAGACSSESGPTKPPHVLFISLDSVRADDLTFTDAERAPHMTKLAERGTIFTRASSGSSWTLPAHVQMFTGQPPTLHGVQADHHRIDPLTKTLPECLAERGYESAGFWSGWYLAAAYGYERGFGRYESAMRVDATADAALNEAIDSRDREQADRAILKREHSSHKEITSQRIVEQARTALEAANPNVPLFLFAHFFDPHYDYIPPAPHDTQFDPDYDGTLTGEDFWANKAIIDRSQRPPERTISDRDLEHIRALYRGEIAWTDAAVGDILELFEERGILDDTLIIITSDHGEEFFEHQNVGHRQSLYEEVLRVPLLVVAPKSAGQRVAQSDVLASLSDLMPTMLEYAGIEEFPATVHGQSLKPAIEGRTLGERALIGSLAMIQGDVTRVIETMTTTDGKLTRRLRVDENGDVQIENAFWTDLASDPGELKPRGKRSNPALRAGWQRMETEMAKLRQLHGELPHSPPSARRTDIKSVFIGELAALGYGGEGDVPFDASKPEWTLGPLPPVPIDGR